MSSIGILFMTFLPSNVLNRRSVYNALPPPPNDCPAVKSNWMKFVTTGFVMFMDFNDF